MDVKLINPFIDATMYVLETLASTKATAGKPYVKKNGAAQGDISGVIGLSGEARGTISVSFSEKCIAGIVSKMFGEEITGVDDEVKDAVGEITNMISGQARQRLAQEGRILKGGVPTVVVGKNHSITHITNRPVIAIPFESQYGGFSIEVCIEDSE